MKTRTKPSRSIPRAGPGIMLGARSMSPKSSPTMPLMLNLVSMMSTLAR